MKRHDLNTLASSSFKRTFFPKEMPGRLKCNDQKETDMSPNKLCNMKSFHRVSKLEALFVVFQFFSGVFHYFYVLKISKHLQHLRCENNSPTEVSEDQLLQQVSVDTEATELGPFGSSLLQAAMTAKKMNDYCMIY